MPEFMNPPPHAVRAPLGLTWLHEDGFIVILNDERDTHTLEDAIENLRIIRGIAGDKPRPLLVDLRRIKTASREAREEYVKPANKQWISAAAAITKSTIAKTVVNIFMHVQKQIVPIKVFNDPEKARKWVMQFV